MIRRFSCVQVQGAVFGKLHLPGRVTFVNSVYSPQCQLKESSYPNKSQLRDKGRFA